MRGGHRVRQVGAKSKASAWGWIAAGILLVLSVGALWWLLGLPGTGRTPIDTAERGGNTPPGEELSLWFASRQEDALVLERRRVPPSQTPIRPGEGQPSGVDCRAQRAMLCERYPPR